MLFGWVSSVQSVELAQKVFVAPQSIMHGHILAAQAMPVPMDKEIADDIALLQAQQQIVNDAEAKLASAYGNKPLAPRGAARMQAAQFQGVPQGRRAPTGQLMAPPSDDDMTGDPRPAAKPWVEGQSPERGYEVAHYAVRNGPADLAEVDGDKVADWNEFFNNMNARVDAPRWGKENMVIDNLDDIEPCRVDCDKDGGNTGEDFAFFGNMLALNVSFQRPFALPWHLSAQSLACLSLFPSSLSLACSVSTSLPVWGRFRVLLSDSKPAQ